MITALRLLGTLCAAGVLAKEFDFVVTRYSKSPDGYLQPVILINGQHPGPTMFLEKGENVTVHVTNNMEQQAVTLHWHGILQEGTPWADGTRGINQCAILPNGGKHTYEFVANDPGTHWYHSHVDFQIDNGAAGVIVVRDPDDEFQVPLSHEVPILLQDWIHGSPMDGWEDFKVLRPGLWFPSTAEQPVAEQIAILPETIAINGRGNFDCHVSVESFHTCEWTADKNLPRFAFTAGDEYRLRFVAGGGSSYAPMTVCLGPKTTALTVIAADGNPLMPLQANCFQINAGQRIDALWRAAEPTRNALYFRVQTQLPVDRPILYGYAAISILDGRGDDMLGSCQASCGETLIGRGSCSCQEDCFRQGNCCHDYAQWCKNLPVLWNGPSEDDFGSLSNLKVLNEFDFRHREILSLVPQPVENYVFEKFITYGMADFNSTSAFLHHPDPLLLQWYRGETEFPPFVKFYKRGSTVDWLFVNMGRMIHPLHFHGHKFFLLGSAYGTSTQQAVFSHDTANLNYLNPPMRDSFDMPGFGWVYVRWVANNPGTWIFHCHIEAHLMMGMSFVAMVGDPDPANASRLIPLTVPAPPKDFSFCTNPMEDCPVGSENCPCTAGLGCDPGLSCSPRWPGTENNWNSFCQVVGDRVQPPPIQAPSPTTSPPTPRPLPQPWAPSRPSGCPTQLSYGSSRTSIPCTWQGSECAGIGYCSINRGLCYRWRQLCQSCHSVAKCGEGLECKNWFCAPKPSLPST